MSTLYIDSLSGSNSGDNVFGLWELVATNSIYWESFESSLSLPKLSVSGASLISNGGVFSDGEIYKISCRYIDRFGQVGELSDTETVTISGGSDSILISVDAPDNSLIDGVQVYRSDDGGSTLYLCASKFSGDDTTYNITIGMIPNSKITSFPQLTNTLPDYFEVDPTIITSSIELPRRDTSTQAVTNILLATVKENQQTLIDGENQGYLYRLNKGSGFNGLEISSVTQLKTGMKTSGKPRWALMQNRAFCVDGVDDDTGTPSKIWTDGTSVYNIGIDAPTVDPTEDSAASTGGYLEEEGVYKIAYAYKRSTEYETTSSISDPLTYTVPASGTDTNKVTIQITYSADTQVDKVRIYRTKIGGSVYYYESEINNVVGTGTTTTDVGTLADDSLSILASNSGAGNGNDPPPASNFVCVSNNRMFYATENRVYWSNVNEPEQVSPDNYRRFDPDDGYTITNMAALGNYLIIQKPHKTWIFPTSSDNLGYVAPIFLSSNIGCMAPDTFQVIGNGQQAIFLSQEGFCTTDGVQIVGITDNKIRNYLTDNVDRSLVSRCKSIYYPQNNGMYVCYVPFLNDNYRIFVYNPMAGFWQQFKYAFQPHCMALWSDADSIRRLILGTSVPGIQDNKYTYLAHFIQADYGHSKDVQYSGTLAGEDVVGYTDITCDVITSWDYLGLPNQQKSIRNVAVEWVSDESTGPTATLYGRADYGRGSNQQKYTAEQHEGIANEPSESDWQHGYDYVNGWDFQSADHSPSAMPELSGTNFSLRFYESSQKGFEVYLFTIFYKVRDMRPE